MCVCSVLTTRRGLFEARRNEIWVSAAELVSRSTGLKNVKKLEGLSVLVVYDEPGSRQDLMLAPSDVLVE